MASPPFRVAMASPPMCYNGAMPRFVLLYHDCPASYERPSHWDFMLEHGDVLRTWAISALPCDWRNVHVATVNLAASCPELGTTNLVLAVPLSDHRSAYLEYEGELSRERGRVFRLVAGTYEAEVERPDRWQVRLSSEVLGGLMTLARADLTSPMWTLAYEPR
ncbi:MAG: hypothetical protein IT425_05675 [Pirellulales bacterium]|nr:hypothetical protein [Pirellulales bacterium]